MSSSRKFIAFIILLTSSAIAAEDDVTPETARQCFDRELTEVGQAARRHDSEALAEKGRGTLCGGLGESWAAGYLAGYLGYRRANVLLAAKDKSADQILRQAAIDLKGSLAADEECAACHALLSAVYGRRISLKPIRGMTLGGRTGRHMAIAREFGTDVPFVSLLDGIGKLHAPATFGGGLPEALELLKAAAFSDFESERWLGFGPADAHYWYGVALLRSGDEEGGRHSFDRALDLAPEYVDARQMRESLGP